MSGTEIIDILDRAHSGHICSLRDWDAKIIPNNVSEKLTEYKIAKTCNPDNPVNTHDSLADEFFPALLRQL